MIRTFGMALSLIPTLALADFNTINSTCVQTNSPYTAIVGSSGNVQVGCLALAGLDIRQRIGALQALQAGGVFVNAGLQSAIGELNYLCAGLARTGDGVVIGNGSIYNFGMNTCTPVLADYTPSGFDLNTVNSTCVQTNNPSTVITGYSGDATAACGSLVGLSVRQRETLIQGLQLIGVPLNLGAQYLDGSVSNICVKGISTGTGVRIGDGTIFNFGMNACNPTLVNY